MTQENRPGDGRGHILVVGAGIGGLSTAIALRGVGYDVHVVELKPDMHSSVFGVGIIQPANALRALDAIGLLDDCLAAGQSSPVWGTMCDVQGNALVEMAGAKIENYPAMNGIGRPKLHQILTRRALADGIRIEYSKSIEKLLPGDDYVEAVFTDGQQDNYELVVGADGVRSEVRPYVLPEGVEPRYNGQSAWRVNLPRIPEIDRIILQRGPSGVAGFVPIAPDLAYFWLNYACPQGYRPPADQLHIVLRDLLKDYGGLTAWVRDNHLNDPAQIVLRPEEYLIAPAPWHKGRIVLIGDAVHTVTPHLGQGAAQAIEDGVVLAEELEANGADVEKAFEAYVGRRFDRCKLVVESCVQIGEWQQHPTPDADQPGLTQRVMEAMVAPL